MRECSRPRTALPRHCISSRLVTCLLPLALAAIFSMAVAQEPPGVLDPHTFRLESFESPESLSRWGFDGPSAKPRHGCLAELSDEWATHGDRAIRLTFLKGGEWPAMHTDKSLHENWPDFAEYESFHVDFLNPHDHAAPGPGSATQGLVFHYGGETHQSKAAVLQPRQERHWGISIWDELAVSKRGEPLDVSRIDNFHFYAWNPARDYTRHIDNIRLTRDLGSQFKQLREAVGMLATTAGANAPAAELRQHIEREYKRFADMPFSKKAFADARQCLKTLEEEVRRTQILLPQYQQRLSEIRGYGQWTAAARQRLVELRTDLHEITQQVLDLPEPGNRFEQLAVTGIQNELRLLKTAAANLAIILPWASPDLDIVVGWHHASTFVKPYGATFTGNFDRAALAGARGEIVGVQIVLFALNEGVTANLAVAGDLPGVLSEQNMTIYAQGFMNLGEAPEGTAGYLLQWHPDILYPLPDTGVSLRPGTPQPYLLQIAIPRDMPAGAHDITLRIETQNGTTALPVALRVYDFEVPKEFTLRTTMGCRTRQDGPLLVGYGLDPGAIYGGWEKTWRDCKWREEHRKGKAAEEAREATAEYEQFIVQQYKNGQQLFVMTNLKGLALAHARRAWAFKGADMEENWENRMGMFERFLERMKELGVPRESFFVYGFDERGPKHADRVREFTRRFNERLQIPLMATPMGAGWLDEPVDTMNWWCGALGTGENRRERIAEIHANGGEAWWYDNNLGFVPDLWVARHKGWYAKHWDMDGYLIYSGHAWSQSSEKALDPQTLPYSNWEEPSLGVRSACGLTYYTSWDVGPEGRYPSFRLWNFRAGLYDYDYLVTLEKLVASLTHAEAAEQKTALLARARQLVDVPDYVVSVPRTIDEVSGASLGLPTAATNAAAAMLGTRQDVAELIESLRPLLGNSDETNKP